MIGISTRGQIHQFYKKVSSWLSFCFPTFNWLSSSQTCRLLVSAGGRGKKISMIFKLKTNQWSHVPPSVTLNECDMCRPRLTTRHRTSCLKPFFSLSLSFPSSSSSIHYTEKLSMMMHALNMVGTYLVNPFYIKIPHECQASSFSSDDFEPQQEAERNSTNLPHEPFQVWSGRKLLQQIFKRTVLVHYLHANERPIPLSPCLIALGIGASRVSWLVIFVFSFKNVKIFRDDCLWKLW